MSWKCARFSKLNSTCCCLLLLCWKTMSLKSNRWLCNGIVKPWYLLIFTIKKRLKFDFSAADRSDVTFDGMVHFLWILCISCVWGCCWHYSIYRWLVCVGVVGIKVHTSITLGSWQPYLGLPRIPPIWCMWVVQSWQLMMDIVWPCNWCITWTTTKLEDHR